MRAAEIMELVADVCGVSITDLRSKSRFAHIQNAKYIAVMLMREECVSEDIIQRFFPEQSRISLQYHWPDAFESLITSDRNFKAQYLACIARISEQDDPIDKLELLTLLKYF